MWKNNSVWWSFFWLFYNLIHNLPAKKGTVQIFLIITNVCLLLLSFNYLSIMKKYIYTYVQQEWNGVWFCTTNELSTQSTQDVLLLCGDNMVIKEWQRILRAKYWTLSQSAALYIVFHTHSPLGVGCAIILLSFLLAWMFAFPTCFHLLILVSVFIPYSVKLQLAHQNIFSNFIFCLFTRIS